MDTIKEIHELELDDIYPSEESIKKKIFGGVKYVIIGKPGSGKSFLIRDLLYRKSQFIPVAVVISGSEETNKFYSSMIPEKFIHNEYDESIVEKFMERQKYATQYIKNPWCAFIMDDCMEDSTIFKKNIMKRLFKNGRHLDMMAIFSSHYVFDLPATIRSNVDGVFIFREPNMVNREKLYKNFAGIIPTFQLFQKLMNCITQDYTALYINNITQSNNWQDCVFFYKAEKHNSFQFGCPEYQNF